MKTTVCANCGIEFGISEQRIKDLKESGDSFYCPNGHGLTFGNGFKDKIKKLEGYIEDLQRDLTHRRTQVIRLHNSLTAYKAHNTRLRNKLKSLK